MTPKLLPLALVLASVPVYAVEPEEVSSKQKEHVWSGDIEFGYSHFTGNTEETNTVGKFLINRESAPWKWQTFVEGLSKTKEGERSDERYAMFTRIEYHFTEKNYLFGRTSYEEDKFSGYERQYTGTAGLGWNLYELETLSWDSEIGIGYRYAATEDVYDDDTGSLLALGEEQKEAIIRLATGLTWEFSENAKFTQTLSTEQGDENNVSTSKTAIQLKIIGELALKLSYDVKYIEKVPLDTKHTDTETVVTLSYSF
ncbi:YdiY family protein [Thalassomonas sp. M1454]|uniref:DUF481 domain-containing protein n=1 Tax=Thalassomonas sp. M1454 TaxID=2594477 RepID=UPI00117E95E6|nr:DUF481 domain-containing protein [Thalassomonas sp. M1454]TRX53922.1 DUF481 domain-containing protein [Thalassomonas sp. M1454]